MHLFLHIGTGRTGTQSLQDFLKKNSEQLAMNGVYYPLTEGKNHHNALALPVCGDRPPRYLMHRYGNDVEKNLKAFHDYFDDIEAKIRKVDPDNVILTSEFLGREFKPELGQPLFDRLTALFDRISVVVYFRSPASYYLSAALQTLKASGILKPPAKQTARKILESYDPLGAELILREYKREALVNGDVCEDFISVVAPDLVGKLPAPSREKNETLSAEVMSIIQDYRNAIWPNDNNKFNEETDGLLATLLDVSNRNGIYEPPQLRPELVAELNALDDDMLWLRDKHGFEYTDVDYTAEPKPVTKIAGTYKRVPDICVFKGGLRSRIMVLALASYTADKAADKSTPTQVSPVAQTQTAAAPAGPGKKPEPDRSKPGEIFQEKPPADRAGAPKPKNLWPGEIERIKEIEPLLRLPEREVYDAPRFNKLFRKSGLIEIRNTFPHFDLADLTDWAVHPTGNPVWRIYFNSMAWTSVFTDEDVNGNPQEPHWKKAFDVLETFVRHVEAEGLRPNNDIWDDHATGYRASYIAWLYTRGLPERITPEFNARLRKVMMLHRKTLMDYLDSEKWQFSNHTLFQAEGLADMAMVFLTDDERRKRTLEFARTKVDEFIERAVSHAEGTVKEHSIFYHVFLMGRLHETCEYFRSIGHPLNNASDDMFTRMNEFLHDIMPVFHRLPGIGDSKHFQRFNKKYIAAFEDPRFQTPRVRYHRSEGKEGEPYPFLSQYPQDGYFIFRSPEPPERQLQSTFLHRPFRGPHGHWDAMSFVCHWHGKPVFIDSGGPFKYANPMRYKYFQTQLAHNAPIFDRDPVEVTSDILGVTTGDGVSAVALSGRMGKGRSWLRIFGQYRNSHVAIIDIPLSSSRKAKPEIRFHIDPEVDPAEDGLTLHTPDGDVAIRQTSLKLAANTIRSLNAGLPGDADAKVESHQTTPSERKETGLEDDFDRRSFVTYKDNEMTEGKLLTFDIPLARATLTSLRFGDHAEEVSLTCKGSILSLDLKGNGTSETLLTFDLSKVSFG
ncbi:hypothetical protein A3731_12265 [Roseovarius sp. HI0049]|nr:hypothetical protein A3731_12265 [Roseovarius sp. HI0049]